MKRGCKKLKNFILRSPFASASKWFIAAAVCTLAQTIDTRVDAQTPIGLFTLPDCCLFLFFQAQPTERGRERPFVLDQYLVEMQDKLNVRSMYGHLFSTKPQCLTQKEVNQLERYHNDKSQLVCKLVQFINRRGAGGVDGFLQALARSVDHGINPGYGDLLQILKDARRRRP